MSDTLTEASAASPNAASRTLSPRDRGILLTILGLIVAFGLWLMFGSGAAPLTTDDVLGKLAIDGGSVSVPRETLVVSGADRGALPPLDNPATIAAGELPAPPDAGKLNNVRSLNPSDRVVGVVMNGGARAYPLWILVWHEVVNDTVSGEPICVTYSPLCDSVVVFSRRVGDHELRFSAGPLLYNSNLVLRDHPPEAAPNLRTSLYSQLLFRAIAGPAADEDRALARIPHFVGDWQTWRAEHPETEIILPILAKRRLYRRDAYGQYYGAGELRYPVSLEPSPDSPPLMSPVVAAPAPDATPAEPRWIVRYASSEKGGEEAGLLRDEVHALWFAWYAMHADQSVTAFETASDAQ